MAPATNPTTTIEHNRCSLIATYPRVASSAGLTRKNRQNRILVDGMAPIFLDLPVFHCAFLVGNLLFWTDEAVSSWATVGCSAGNENRETQTQSYVFLLARRVEFADRWWATLDDGLFDVTR